MPSVYLSPSTQDFNQFINGGSEEYYMNLIADAMIPYLRASGIEFERNNPGDSVSMSIARSNEEPYGLHLAIQSSATPEGYEEPQRGIDVYYYGISPVGGERAAYIAAENLKNIYPLPERVITVPNLILRELLLTEAPAILVEIGYYDNLQDALWIQNNIQQIGKNLAMSVAQFLNVPFKEPEPALRF